MKSLFFGAFIAAASNLLFALLAVAPISIYFLITVITADNISSGFAGAAFGAAIEETADDTDSESESSDWDIAKNRDIFYGFLGFFPN